MEAAAFPELAAVPCDGEVRMSGTALKISENVLRRAIESSASLCCALAHAEEKLLVQTMQKSACNAFHSAEQRCIRWLLAFRDLTGSLDLPLTHEVLAAMLGVRRPTMTVVLGSLRRAGLVAEERGRIHLLAQDKLERACCECYRLMRPAG